MNNRKPIFGNYEANYINYETKQKIVDYLYSKIDLSKHRYTLLKDINTLKFLKDNEHYVSPNLKGLNYLIVITTFENRKYCIAIDRKKLSYHKNHLDMKTIQLFQINLKSTENIFKGTIFDGKLINIEGKYMFMISDCFHIEDTDILNMNMLEKINYLDNILKNNLLKCNNFEFKLNKLVKYNELEDTIYKIVNNKFNKLSANGLIFYPTKSGNTIIYIDNNYIQPQQQQQQVHQPLHPQQQQQVHLQQMIHHNNKIISSDTYHIIYEFVNFLKARTYSYETNNNNKILYLSKTLIPDVYNISETISSEKMGIALIPNLKISHMCSDLVNDTPVRFNCVFNDKFKKWVPINPV
jgi:hypothetical protein